MSEHKLTLTKNLKFVLSIPLIQWYDNTYVVKGVINVDANDDETASYLFSDSGRPKLEEITAYFKNYAELYIEMAIIQINLLTMS
ncbi:MAG: hypothetical protein AB1480_03725 [Nitrospirota bacterium]